MGIVAAAGKSVRATPEPSWQVAMQTAIRSGVELCQRLELGASWEAAAQAAERQFPVFAPLGFVAKMERGNPHDPLLRQVLPWSEELQRFAGFGPDPVGDTAAARQPGLLQKYPGRALLITTGTCAIHCRYCFRREFPYSDSSLAGSRWSAAVQHLAADPSIQEVILSGGDPLTVPDRRLAELVTQLAEIPHLRRLRIHSRVPVVIPERVVPELLNWLTGTRLQPVFIIHANHSRELDGAVASALRQLSLAGVPLLNQAVLLRGVNDSESTLLELSNRLVDLRVTPYYLHQLDRVQGAAHFEVPIERGRQLMAYLRARLPGYAVPRYVQEVAGESSKIPLDGC